MRLLVTKLENIVVTIITMNPIISPWILILLVRLGGYIVNLCDFYFYKIIGKLTGFLQIQEFSLRNQTVDSSTTVARCSLPTWDLSVGIFLVKTTVRPIILNIDEVPVTSSLVITHSPITLANLSSVNLVSIFRCSSSPHNPVYVRRVVQSVLVFSLSSHRHSCGSLLLSSHSID